MERWEEILQEIIRMFGKSFAKKMLDKKAQEKGFKDYKEMKERIELFGSNEARQKLHAVENKLREILKDNSFLNDD